MSASSLVTSVFRIGAACIQHVGFVKSATEAGDTRRMELLRGYVTNLSNAGFAGFKVTLLALANREKDLARKAIIASLLKASDSARAGGLMSAAPEPIAESTAAPSGETCDAHLALLDRWWQIEDEELLRQALVGHLATLNDRQFAEFSNRLETDLQLVNNNISRHEKNELNAWGQCFEDRMAYFMAREKSGSRDPRWQEEYDYLKKFRRFVEFLIKGSKSAWPEILRRKSLR